MHPKFNWSLLINQNILKGESTINASSIILSIESKQTQSAAILFQVYIWFSSNYKETSNEIVKRIEIPIEQSSLTLYIHHLDFLKLFRGHVIELTYAVDINDKI